MAAKAERGKIWTSADREHNYQSSKSTDCAFSRYRMLLLRCLEDELPADEARRVLHSFGLEKLGLAYERDHTIEETAEDIIGVCRVPRATVVRSDGG